MTQPLANDRLLRALLRQPVDRTPIWIMRQAGRYLPEYRATRTRAGSFLDLCQNPELACEVTLQPLRRFPLDAAILFSDILTVPDAMGLGLYFEAGEGPRFRDPVRSLADIERLPIPDPEQELRYVMDAVRLIRRELNGSVPLIGFSGSPWTLATYMVEGAGSRDFAETKRLLYGEPQAMHAFAPEDLRGRYRLSQCPDPGRGAGSDDLRYLGWFADTPTLPGILARLHGAHHRRSDP
jgi:uroporphyrinogen decarboxylase